MDDAADASPGSKIIEPAQTRALPRLILPLPGSDAYLVSTADGQ